FSADDLYFSYYKDIAVWGYGATACNDFYSFYIDFVLSVSIMCCILLLDAISVLTLRKALDLSKSSDTLKRQRKVEIGFFVQSLCQMVPYILAYVSFDILSRFANTDWMLFGTTT
ncbi:hypothetical protein PENTCL1PPCAC_17072, partial [Pristionchus entomophagus]